MHILPGNKADRATLPLSGRLSAIAESLPKGGVVCDVGSDHGALPLFLLQNHWCDRAVVTDLNLMPLERAKKNLTEHGVSSFADFVLTDGILEVFPYNAGSYVIAGMGGETIVGILSRALHCILQNTVFVLQPMTKSVFLRRFLYENGFRIEMERVVAENDKFFLIIKAVYDGVVRVMDDDVYLVGEHLRHSDDATVFAFWERKLLKVRARIEGRTKAMLPVDVEKREEALFLSLMEEKNENS